MIPDPGTCRGYLDRFFYNSTSGKCEKFKYGGCLDNENEFLDNEECQAKCGSE
ncbi:unnamed protein product [Trichobilharzia regenti]|nr:unnamed protein product [Trichobilharzia regenti]